MSVIWSRLEKCGCPHNDALIVTIQVRNFSVAHVLIDMRSEENLIFSSTLSHMGIMRTDISPSDIIMVGFNGKETYGVGQISLTISTDLYNIEHPPWLCYHTPSPFNMIMGRPLLHKLRAHPSTYQTLWCPTPQGQKKGITLYYHEGTMWSLHHN